ncbi:MAG: LLM class flavin-dependent oxidoreductase, partial [Alphaproteobacteria bacterium]
MTSSDRSANPMFGPNPFKLGIFSANADGGLAITRVPERWAARWDDVVTVARLADRAGIEFFLPIARWKGFGGETNARSLSYETLTWAAALAGLTERMCLFATVHAPLVHPVFAAKALATIDQASHGRAGLNIVCGWNAEEFAMFGSAMVDHDGRYDQGLEWYEILSRIVRGDGPFDYAGHYYTLTGVEGRPATVQQPRPVTMSAAFSPAGRRFAAGTSDFLFTVFGEIEAGQQQIAAIRQLGADAGRDLSVFTTSHVVCRESDREAEEYYHHYAEDMADHGAVDHHMAMRQSGSQQDPEVFRRHRKRFAGGVGTFPLIGAPETIVRQMMAMHEAGFAGTTLSFVNFLDELPFFLDRVLPL